MNQRLPITLSANFATFKGDNVVLLDRLDVLFLRCDAFAAHKGSVEAKFYH
jgi:hypothetical protein